LPFETWRPTLPPQPWHNITRTICTTVSRTASAQCASSVAFNYAAAELHGSRLHVIILYIVGKGTYGQNVIIKKKFRLTIRFNLFQKSSVVTIIHRDIIWYRWIPTHTCIRSRSSYDVRIIIYIYIYIAYRFFYVLLLLLFALAHTYARTVVAHTHVIYAYILGFNKHNFEIHQLALGGYFVCFFFDGEGRRRGERA